MDVRQRALADAKTKVEELRAEHDAKRTSKAEGTEAVKSAHAALKLALAAQKNGDWGRLALRSWEALYPTNIFRNQFQQ